MHVCVGMLCSSSYAVCGAGVCLECVCNCPWIGSRWVFRSPSIQEIAASTMLLELLSTQPTNPPEDLHCQKKRWGADVMCSPACPLSGGAFKGLFAESVHTDSDVEF